MTTAQLLLTIGMMIAAYVAGSVPFSFLVARARGIDLRKVGSGNVGSSNVWRNIGFGPFLLAAAGDLLKGAVPTYVAIQLGLPPIAVVLVGIAAILGHTYSLFLHFRGGKAVATSGGVLLALAPLVVLVGLLVWVAVLLIGRMSSVASLSAAAAVAITGTVLYANGQIPLEYLAFIWIAVALIFYLHRENIKRILAGKETKFQKLF